MASAPVARGSGGTAKSNQRSSAPIPVVPFPISSLKRMRQGFDTGNLTPGQSVSALEIPAAGGYLRFIEMVVTLITAGNSAATAFNADGPWNVLQFIEFLPPSGDPPIVPHTGYQLMLWNKYGFFSQSPPYCDPRRDPNYTAVTGTGATGGSASFTLRLPFEIDPASGYCSITNSASNKSYLLNLITNTSAAIYSTAPTVAPAIRIVGWMYFWDEPTSSTRQGTNQNTGPLDVGSYGQLRIDTPPVTPGDKYLKINNGGPVLRTLLMVLRTSAGARVTTLADVPQLWDLVFNNRDRFIVSDLQLLSDIAEAYGYQQGTGGTAPNTFGIPTQGGYGLLPQWDVSNGLDQGVRTFPYLNDFGGINPTNPRTQYQVTGDATLLQIRGTSFGASVATVELLTSLIRPRSSAGLYPSDRI